MGVLSSLAGVVLGAALTIACGASAPAELPTLPAVGRPTEASQGPRVAVIVAARGDVSVEPSHLSDGSTSFPAVAQLQLLRDDRLIVGPKSFVLVALHNGHIVRLNEGSSLRVDTLAAFGDPPAGSDIEERFAARLLPEERDDADLRGAITRVAGWNTRLSAAETIAPQPAQQPMEPPLADTKRERVDPVVDGPQGGGQAGLPGSADRPTDLPGNGAPKPREEDDGIQSDAKTTPRRPPVKDPEKGSPKRAGDEENDEEKSKTESSRGPTPASPPPANAKKSTSSPGLDLPETVEHRSDADGTRKNVGLPGTMRPLRAELAQCAGRGGKIRVQVRGQKVVALEINGAPGKCPVDLIGKTVAEPDGWLTIPVKS